MRSLVVLCLASAAACAPGTFKTEKDGGSNPDDVGIGHDGGSSDARPSFMTTGVLVDYVNDGDTIILRANLDLKAPDGMPLNDARVRLLGLDAPEIAHDNTPADCHGDAAHAYLRGQIDGRVIDLEYDPTKCKPGSLDECRDDFGRLLAYVSRGGTVINRELLRLGHAKVFGGSRFRHRDSDEYAAIQATARSANLGVWACP